MEQHRLPLEKRLPPQGDARLSLLKANPVSSPNSTPPRSGRTDEVEVSNWRLLQRLLGLSWNYRRSVVVILLLQAAMLVMTLSGLGLIGVGIDTIRRHADQAAPEPQWPFGISIPDQWSFMTVMGIVAAAILLLGLLRATLQNRYTTALNSLVQGNVVVALRHRVYDKLQRLSFRFFDGNESGSIINRVTSDVQNVAMFLNGVLFNLINLLISLVIFLTWMFSIHAGLTFACLTTMPALWISAYIYAKLIRKDFRKSRKRRDDLVLRISESVQGIHVVKGFARQEVEIDKFRQANNRVTEILKRIFLKDSIYIPGTETIMHLNTVILLAYGGVLVIRGELALGGGLWVFAGLLSEFSAQIQMIARVGNRIQDCLTSADRVFEILDSPLEIESPTGAVVLERARGDVRFENVQFGYRLGETVLQDITLHAAPGQCVAIVGSTAAGKSTLLSLIPRFYDPQQGRVRLDGTDVRDLDVESLRRQIGIVFQESFLFSNTIAANIAFGHPEATDEQIRRAAEIACAHDFITAMPDGYCTVIGERGIDLSGGQRQRLALARAILLEPSILLLDDPTASIDPETEHEILEAVENVMHGRTTFVIAHRLSTLRRAAHVIVLDRGRIVEAGSHERLMKDQGHYRKTADLQVADKESKRLLGVV